MRCRGRGTPFALDSPCCPFHNHPPNRFTPGLLPRRPDARSKRSSGVIPNPNLLCPLLSSLLSQFVGSRSSPVCRRAGWPCSDLWTSQRGSQASLRVQERSRLSDEGSPAIQPVQAVDLQAGGRRACPRQQEWCRSARREDSADMADGEEETTEMSVFNGDI